MAVCEHGIGSHSVDVYRVIAGPVRPFRSHPRPLSNPEPHPCLVMFRLMYSEPNMYARPCLHSTCLLLLNANGF